MKRSTLLESIIKEGTSLSVAVDGRTSAITDESPSF